MRPAPKIALALLLTTVAVSTLRAQVLGLHPGFT